MRIVHHFAMSKSCTGHHTVGIAGTSSVNNGIFIVRIVQIGIITVVQTIKPEPGNLIAVMFAKLTDYHLELATIIHRKHVGKGICIHCIRQQVVTPAVG